MTLREIFVEDAEEAEALRLAGTLEDASEHPIAQAIAQRHHARLVLDQSTRLGGLQVELLFEGLAD